MTTYSPPKLAFPGFCLRPFAPGDELIWFDYLRQPEVLALTGWAIASSAELTPLLSPAAGEPIMRFAIVDAANRLAGTAGFFDWADGQAELAYDLAPQHWGKGLASAACLALCEWGFAELKLARIKACVLSGNRTSARVLEKCGFELEGMVREARHADGTARDYKLYRRRTRQGI